ncbi:MAG: hypothetical protein ACKOE2_08740, partial [Actinomycetales bacterium]
MPESVITSAGRVIWVFGQAGLLTGELLGQVLQHFDDDPRIASVSLVAGSDLRWLRATAPSGPVVAVATDLDALTGPVDQIAGSQEVAGLAAWARRA